MDKETKDYIDKEVQKQNPGCFGFLVIYLTAAPVILSQIFATTIFLKNGDSFLVAVFKGIVWFVFIMDKLIK